MLPVPKFTPPASARRIYPLDGEILLGGVVSINLACPLEVENVGVNWQIPYIQTSEPVGVGICL